jgi:transketolase
MPLTDSELRELKEKARGLRKDIVDVTYWAGGAHIGGAMSVIDILTLLYFKVAKLDPQKPEWPDRDRIVVSKGHAGVAIAPTLARRGYFDFELLREFNKFKSPFGMHLDSLKVKGVDVSTGSLGHGLPQAVGLALGARFQKKDWRTFCILGDGECNEGAIWEAAMAASHYKLTNLVTYVDRNMLMIDGPTEEVMGIEPLADKWKAFGFTVREVDGHDFPQLAEATDFALQGSQGPVVIIARTTKGKGVDYMENQVKWHYGSVDSELADRAKQSIDSMYKG